MQTATIAALAAVLAPIFVSHGETSAWAHASGSSGAHVSASASTSASTSARPIAARAKSIAWSASYEDALTAAAEDNRVVFIAINMDGERANERMVKDVYRDKRILALTESTVNLIASPNTHSKSGKCSRFGCESCDSHLRTDVAVRSEVFPSGVTGSVIAPQHVFLRPSGEIILSVPFEVSASELEWCFHTALLAMNPDYDGKRSGKERRPRRLIMGGVVDLGEDGVPITREEALAIIKEHRKGNSRDAARSNLRRLATADEPEAREYIVTVLRAGGGGGGGGRRGGGGGGNNGRAGSELLRWIGVASPVSYWEICAEFADSGAAGVQREAVVALEQIAASESLPMLMKALRRSSEEAETKNILRAIGSSARDDKKARKALLRSSIEKDAPVIRRNALIALGWLDDTDEIDDRLKAAALPKVHGEKSKVELEDVTDEERLAAVVAMGLTRGERWRDLLGALAVDEDAPESLRKAAEASLAVVGGAPYDKLAKALVEASGDTIPRERLFPATAQRR